MPSKQPRPINIKNIQKIGKVYLEELAIKQAKAEKFWYSPTLAFFHCQAHKALATQLKEIGLESIEDWFQNIQIILNVSLEEDQKLMLWFIYQFTNLHNIHSPLAKSLLRAFKESYPEISIDLTHPGTNIKVLPISVANDMLSGLIEKYNYPKKLTVDLIREGCRLAQQRSLPKLDINEIQGIGTKYLDKIEQKRKERKTRCGHHGATLLMRASHHKNHESLAERLKEIDQKRINELYDSLDRSELNEYICVNDVRNTNRKNTNRMLWFYLVDLYGQIRSVSSPLAEDIFRLFKNAFPSSDVQTHHIPGIKMSPDETAAKMKIELMKQFNQVQFFSKPIRSSQIKYATPSN